ncbi:MAG: hypothetical protein GF383_14770 [Candidatus Lokiarchaeota archaeon]|nr:hypothetical protein [Candidatus Lokiarchaeota archaeon]MBD3342679.1 hypothetical protein [Candidatus Lokiarchaeota archaeon]
MKRPWVKLRLFYLGASKKHHIFRTTQWDTKLETIFKKQVFDEQYEKIGSIKDIFGPAKLPFISLKAPLERTFNPSSEFYVKVG